MLIKKAFLLKPLFLFNLLPKCLSDKMAGGFQSEKDKYLNMPVEDKRKIYQTKDYKTIADVPTWFDYFSSKKDVILEKSKNLEKFEIDVDPKASDFSKKVSLWQGDITSLEVDVIVNAANNALLGGGGVDGSIHRAAGPLLKVECKTLNGCETGDAKITGAYKLPSKYVIHTVGPIGEKPDLLRSAYEKSLHIMKNNNLKTIAFPCISTGVYGYPQNKAAQLVLHTIYDFLKEHSESVDRIVFCLFLQADVDIYEHYMQSFFPVNTGQ